jgi:hypothetical protein
MFWWAIWAISISDWSLHKRSSDWSELTINFKWSRSRALITKWWANGNSGSSVSSDVILGCLGGVVSGRKRRLQYSKLEHRFSIPVQHSTNYRPTSRCSTRLTSRCSTRLTSRCSTRLTSRCSTRLTSRCSTRLTSWCSLSWGFSVVVQGIISCGALLLGLGGVVSGCCVCFCRAVRRQRCGLVSAIPTRHRYTRSRPNHQGYNNQQQNDAIVNWR